MTTAHLTFGPIRDSDIKLDPDLEAKVRPRVRRMSVEEFEKLRRTVIFHIRTEWGQVDDG